MFIRPSDDATMPIDTRPPRADTAAAPRSAATKRHGDATATGMPTPGPGVLLPSGHRTGSAPSPAPASGSTPQRALAQDALRLLRRVADPARRPERWLDEDVARDIALIRRHLAPLRSRRALAASFSREAFHRQPDEMFGDRRMVGRGSAANHDGTRANDPDPDAGPVRIAYAIRWLELGDGVDRPAWPRLIATR